MTLLELARSLGWHPFPKAPTQIPWVATNDEQDNVPHETLIATSDVIEKAKFNRIASTLQRWRVASRTATSLTVGEATDILVSSSFAKEQNPSDATAGIATAELCLTYGDASEQCVKQSLDLRQPILPRGRFRIRPEEPGEVYARVDLRLSVDVQGRDITSQESTLVNPGNAQATWGSLIRQFLGGHR